MFKICICVCVLLFQNFESLTACPPDEEQLKPISEELGKKFTQICVDLRIKIGGQADVHFLNTVLLPYYISKAWLTKDPPKGFEAEKDKILNKCHKDTYNYCNENDRKRAGDCVKGMAGSLMLKYGATAMAYCPILDKKVENWKTNDRNKALAFLTQYCKTKGKTC